MRKEVTRVLALLALTVAVAFTTAATSANPQSRTIVAKIPFAFTVGDKALPAGQYTVRAASQNGDVLAIQNRESDQAAMRLTNSIIAGKVPENAKLVFHRYGPRYFLAEVWSPGDSTGRKLLKSNEERTIESQLAAIFPKNELARNYEVVEIVATLY